MDKEDIVYADKNYRKKFIIGFILVALVTASLLHYVNVYIDQLSSKQSLDNQFTSVEEVMTFTLLIRSITTIGFAIAGIYWISIGYRTLKHNRFPPLGMKVLKDTKIKKGRSAKAMAYWLFVGAILLITLPNIAFWYMHKVFESVKANHYEIEQLINRDKSAHNNLMHRNAHQR
jgi:magnesium-transporting ATPase (P-type)